MALVLLTQTNGARLWINPNEVVAISDRPIGYPKECKTLVIVHDKSFCVKESPEEVLSRINIKEENK